MKVVIIGMGIAGLTAAITGSERGDDITVVVKDATPLSSASAWAQGGIAFSGHTDTPERLMADMLQAAGGMTRTQTLNLLATEGPQFVKDFFIDKLAVPFARQAAAQQQAASKSPSALHQTAREYQLTKEAGHSCSRILFSGDSTGEVIIAILYKYLQEKTNVKILANHLALDLINIPHHSVDSLAVYEETRCVGVYVLDKQTTSIHKLFADKILLATGGIGAIYKHNTNPPSATGDGIALAYRAGARVINMEFTQFHPTALANRKANGFLISEALRGEGAIVVNERGEAFVDKVDARGSLTPRDRLSRIILAEQQRTHEDHVYLLYKDSQFDLAERFPKIAEKCSKLGIDTSRGRIPVTPAFHFSCGGILVNADSQTSISNLYAVGECACTGVHGANRLASTSLLEASYFARRAVAHTPPGGKKVNEDHIHDWRCVADPSAVDAVLLYHDHLAIQALMWNYVGVIRKPHTLARALQELRSLKERVEGYYRRTLPSQRLVELRNMVQVAILVTEAAIKNRVSMGSHYLERD